MAEIRVEHCLDTMKGMASDSVDLVVTSPPYDNLRTYNGYSFDFESIAQELARVMKPGGVIVWVVGDATIQGTETGTSFRQALFFKELGFNLHDTMIYMAEKPPLTHRRYEQKFEYMFVFSKGKPKTFNPLLQETIYAGQNKQRRTMRQDGDELSNRSGKGFVKDYKIKGNVWVYSIGNNKSAKDKSAFKHPAIFPEQLAIDHIKSWSNINDLVYDPFTGSGTTGLAAKKLSRRFIGSEISADYAQVAAERIDNG